MDEDTDNRDGKLHDSCDDHLGVDAGGGEDAPPPARTILFDVTSATGAAVDQLVTETVELVAKIAASALVLYFSMTELFDELQTYRNRRRN